MSIERKNMLSKSLSDMRILEKTGSIFVSGFSQKQTKPILYFDMDDVVADFWKAIKLNNPRIDDEKYFPTLKHKSKEVDLICKRNPRIFKHLSPVEGAIESTKPLFEKFDVYFLSTPMYEVPESYMDKRLWLHQHYGDLAEKRLILTHRKDLAIGDYLVDDRLVNGSENFLGKFIHYGSPAFPDWDSVLKFLNTQA